MKPRNIYAVVRTEAAARAVVDALCAEGFDKARISLLAREGARQQQIEAEAGDGVRVPQGIAAGAALGGALGWLAAVAALTIPGIGAVIAAGPILAGLGGAAVGAASGMVAGSFIGLGMSEIEAREFQEAAVRGEIVLAVEVVSIDQQKRAERVLAASGACNVTTTGAEPHAA